MATQILVKKSGDTGNTPEAVELSYGELALNYADGKLFYKSSSDEIKAIANIAQGELADTALQPVSVDYRGPYDNGDGTYAIGAVVLYNRHLYEKISNPGNAGYPPTGTDWQLFEPLIGSPAYDLFVTTQLNSKVDKVDGQGLSDENYTLTEKNKLDGISAEATVNSTDAYLLDRTHHTGTQSYSTVTGLGTLATQDGTFSGTSSGTNTGDQTITLGGDATGNGTALVNVTLANTGVVAGEYNNGTTTITPFTVDSKGRITSTDTPVTLTPDWSSVANTPSTLDGYNITDAVNLDGTQTISGAKEFTTSPIVPRPTESGHAATKAYADDISAGLHVHEQVHVILTVTLASATGGTVAYTNGTDGVGAKLTVTGGSTIIDALNSACGADDDLAVGTPGSRIIINGEGTNKNWNGIYTISADRELTRAADFDNPVEMAGGDFVFVTHGTTHADTGWVLSEPVTTVGSSNVEFVQFSGQGSYDAGDGLHRDGTVFSVVGTAGRIVVGPSVDLATHGTAGTYQSVTTDTYGRVTSGSNPTTLAGYGITDAASSTSLSTHVSDDARHLTSEQNTLIDGITVTSTKINYLSDVTSAIQSQIDGKSATLHTHVSANITDATADGNTNKGKILKTDSSGFVKVAKLSTGVIESAVDGYIILQNATIRLMRIGSTPTGTPECTISGSFASGESTASGAGAHSSGNSQAIGDYSHSEGYLTIANGNFSHAEGYQSSTGIDGIGAHAEGYQSEANGLASHASGYRAKATLDGTRVMTDYQDADEISTLANQMTCRFENGYQFKGGNATFQGEITSTNLSGSNTGDQTITLTGDITGTGTGSFATTLKDTGPGVGTYQSVTIDAKGRVTAGTNPTTLAGYNIADAVSAVTPIVSISSPTTFAAADNAKIFHVSGETTLTLPVASSVSDGWSIGIVNVSGNTLTFNRSGSDTVNGLTTFNNTIAYSAVYIYKSSSSTFVAIGILY